VMTSRRWGSGGFNRGKSCEHRRPVSCTVWYPAAMHVTEAEIFAHEWLVAWNSRDLDTIMGHYHEDSWRPVA
jgi:hypothetical protein